MAIEIDRVQPGDLITSALRNRLIELIVSIDARVAELEEADTGGTGDAPFLGGRSPSGDIRAGSALTLTGRNFLVPTRLNTVEIGPASVSAFQVGSDDRTLIFTVPTTLPGLPASLPVRVSNRNGVSAPLTVRFLPRREEVTGTLVVKNVTGDLGTIEEDKQYTFLFELDSRTNVPEAYLIEARYSEAKGGPDEDAWSDATTLVGAADGEIEIKPGEPRTIGARVTVPSNATSVELTVGVQSVNAHPELSRSFGPIPIVVGQAPEESDERTTLSLKKPTVDPNARNAVIDGTDGFEVPFGGTGTIMVDAKMDEAGSYAYTAEIDNAGALWQVTRVSPATSVEAAGGEQRIDIRTNCNASSASGRPEKRSMKVTATRKKPDGSDDFKSFIRFPIAGYEQ